MKWHSTIQIVKNNKIIGYKCESCNAFHKKREKIKHTKTCKIFDLNYWEEYYKDRRK